MRNETGLKLRVFLMAGLLLATSSCSLTKGKGLAEAAVAHFHEQYNSGQFHEIYNQADEEFRKGATEAHFMEVLEALRRKLGTVKQSTQTGWNVNATPMGTMVTLSYAVEFSEGKGTEQFVFRVSGGKALLYNYNVNSPLLLTK